MSQRRIQPSRYVARSGAGGLLIVALVAGSLLSFPTRCACGAPLPHEHSLFELQGHWHGPANSPEDGVSASYDGPSVQGPSTALGLAVDATATADSWLKDIDRVASSVSSNEHPGTGRNDTPAVPPPRG